MKPLVYLAHPVRGNTPTETEVNIHRAKHWLGWCIRNHPNHLIIAPWLPELDIFDESDDRQRETALQRCLEVVERCDELWLTGPRVTSGMAMEAARAKDRGIRIMDFTLAGCVMPPADGAPFARMPWRAA